MCIKTFNYTKKHCFFLFASRKSKQLNPQYVYLGARGNTAGRSAKKRQIKSSAINLTKYADKRPST